MGTLHTFHSRPAAPVPPPYSPADVRAQIEEAAQVALDMADRLLAILDRMDGGNAEPSLGAPENQHGSQVVWLRGNDQDGEVEAPNTVLPVVAVVRPEPDVKSWTLPWSGFRQRAQSSRRGAARHGGGALMTTGCRRQKASGLVRDR